MKTAVIDLLLRCAVSPGEYLKGENHASMKKNPFRWCIGLVLIVLLAGCGFQKRSNGLAEPVETEISKLIIEEYAVCSASVDAPDHFEFRQRIPENVLAFREDWRIPGAEARLKTQNTVLESFGCELRPHPEDPEYSYQVMRGDEVLVDDVTYFWSATIRADGADFALPVENDHGKRLLVSKNGAEPLEEVYAIATLPIYVGNDLVRAEVQGNRVVVIQGDEPVFSTRVKDEMAVSSPLKGFWSWQEGWALEVTNEVFINGESLNRQLGFDQIFDWQLLDGEPFYFFVEHERDGMVGIVYAGQVMSERYDEVVHYRCCEPAAFNVNSNEHMVWFYALRDGTWYYVEAGQFGDIDT